MLIFKGGVVADYRDMFPNTSFTAYGPNDEFLKENDAYRVTTWLPHDLATEKLVSSIPYIKDGVAYTVVVEPKTQQELDADYQAKASAVRAQRNRLLSECDWTQLADAQVDKDVWATYRQALRDVPSQPGFPDNVVWPEKP
jgi:hypothetical protein